MLKVTTDSLENCEVLMTVEVDEQQTDKLLKAAAQRISKQIKIPGFRPGKAPYRMIVRRVGEETVHDEVMEDLSQSVFKQALEQAELEPYAPASMEDVSWDPLVMKVRVPVAPIIELGDYRAMRMEVEPVEVSEAEVDEALKNLQEEYAVWNPVERPAHLGDMVTMAVKEQIGEDVLGDEENVEYELTEKEEDGSGPDLTVPLIGLSAGDEKEFSLTYPQSFSDSRYAGKEVAVSVKVHGVKEKETYPLDDDFAQTVGDFDTLQELKEKLTEDIRQQKEREADDELSQEALKQLLENAERIEWPSVLEEEEIDQMLSEQDRRLQQSGLNLDTYLSIQKKTREQLREEFRPAAQERLRRSLALSELVELEDLSVAGHEVSGQIDRLSLMAGERGDELRQALATPDNVQYIVNDLLTSKALKRLTQIVKGEAETEKEKETEAGADIEVEAETETDIEVEAETETDIEVEAETETEAVDNSE
ncbi:MAG: trigger factor [Anaerolineae bacterium]